MGELHSCGEPQGCGYAGGGEQDARLCRFVKILYFTQNELENS